MLAFTERDVMRLTLLIAFIALVSACVHGPITAVAIRDSDFKVIKKLSATELAQFELQWNEKARVDASLKEVGGMHLKLDILREDEGDRWLYQTTGYVQVLSVWKTPVYKVPDPTVFNELIGAKQ